jgi:hypothetical protein
VTLPAHVAALARLLHSQLFSRQACEEVPCQACVGVFG